MSVPTMSAGSRSGVNWMRLNFACTAVASVRTESVLARPGTPSSRTWPLATVREQPVHELFLADDDVGDFLAQLANPGGGLRDLIFQRGVHVARIYVAPQSDSSAGLQNRGAAGHRVVMLFGAPSVARHRTPQGDSSRAMLGAPIEQQTIPRPSTVPV